MTSFNLKTHFFPFAPLTTVEQPGLPEEEFKGCNRVKIQEIQDDFKASLTVRDPRNWSSSVVDILLFSRFKLFQCAALGGGTVSMPMLNDLAHEWYVAIRDLLCRSGWKSELRADKGMMYAKPVWHIDDHNQMIILQESSGCVAMARNCLTEVHRLRIQVDTLTEKVNELETALLYQTGNEVMQEAEKRFKKKAKKKK